MGGKIEQSFLVSGNSVCFFLSGVCVVVEVCVLIPDFQKRAYGFGAFVVKLCRFQCNPFHPLGCGGSYCPDNSKTAQSHSLRDLTLERLSMRPTIADGRLLFLSTEGESAVRHILMCCLSVAHL